MNFDLRKSTVLLTLTGSRAYGFSNENSDWDYRGICICPLDSYIGVMNKFEQAVDKSNKEKHVWKHYSDLVKPDSDMQVMEICKFVRLALNNNPSIMEILFSDEENIVYKNPIIDKLLQNKELFLSKKIKSTFAGYAYDQFHKMQNHKKWIDDPPTKKPLRSDFGLSIDNKTFSDQIGAAEAIVQKEINKFIIHQDDLSEDLKIELKAALGKIMRVTWKALHTEPYPVGRGQKFNKTEEALSEGMMRQEGFSENFIEILRKERKFRAALQDWNSYQTWLKDRNPIRAELEIKTGIDLKNAVHLVRLLRMASEVLTTGKFYVKRPDAKELGEIRNGHWSFEKICEFFETENAKLDGLVEQSTLPSSPDINKIHQILFEIVMEFNSKKDR